MSSDVRHISTRPAVHKPGILAVTIILIGLAPLVANAQRSPIDTEISREKVLPNLVPESVTLTQVFTTEPMVNNTMKQRFRICVRNGGITAAKPPADPGWWSIIYSYPDDKGGRPNAYYWSRHKVSTALSAGQSYCFNRDLWVTNCRASKPRIRVTGDADKGITESNEDDNRKDFYPTAFCSN
jgi:hypothetical protein